LADGPNNNDIDPTLKLEVEMLSGEIQILPIHKTYKDYNNNNSSESNIFKAYYHFIVDWGDGTSE
jgi:hypothetical protein